MNKFLFKSTDADLQKMFSILETIQKNVLYLTYRIDTILKNTNKVIVDKNLQSQVDQFFEETSPQTDSDEQQLVIKTAVKPKGPKLPSKKPFGAFYDTAKEVLKTYGYYEDIKQYDPGYYFDKYTYKPQKRIAGYLGQKIYGFPKKKRFRNNYQFFQKCTGWFHCNDNHSNFTGYYQGS